MTRVFIVLAYIATVVVLLLAVPVVIGLALLVLFVLMGGVS